MTGLPREKDVTRPQDAWTLLVCGGVEKLTYALQRGDPFSDRAVSDMLALQRRLGAFSNALDARMPVVEK
jgi:hypothetical protein